MGVVPRPITTPPRWRVPTKLPCRTLRVPQRVNLRCFFGVASRVDSMVGAAWPRSDTAAPCRGVCHEGVAAGLGVAVILRVMTAAVRPAIARVVIGGRRDSALRECMIDTVLPEVSLDWRFCVPCHADILTR
jgi:hypothetical protein